MAAAKTHAATSNENIHREELAQKKELFLREEQFNINKYDADVRNAINHIELNHENEIDKHRQKVLLDLEKEKRQQLLRPGIFLIEESIKEQELISKARKKLAEIETQAQANRINSKVADTRAYFQGIMYNEAEYDE